MCISVFATEYIILTVYINFVVFVQLLVKLSSPESQTKCEQLIRSSTYQVLWYSLIIFLFSIFVFLDILDAH